MSSSTFTIYYLIYKFESPCPSQGILAIFMLWSDMFVLGCMLNVVPQVHSLLQSSEGLMSTVLGVDFMRLLCGCSTNPYAIKFRCVIPIITLL